MQATLPYAQYRIRDQLELAGLDVNNTERLPGARHVLLMPVGLQLTDSEDPDWEEGGLRWDRIELRDQKPTSTIRCMWDFIELVDGSAEDFIGFVGKWGLFDFGEDADHLSEDQEGWSGFVWWRAAALEARSALITMVASEAGELISEEILEILHYWDDFQPDIWDGYDFRKHGKLSPDRILAMLIDKKRERWQVERRAGRGLALQRRFIVNFFNGPWMMPLELAVSWDDEGRRVETVAHGARQVAGAHLLSIFNSPEVDVFICSVCGKPYPLEPLEGHRRPRRGRRRFCSEACKLTARRSDNLASWHRNKAKWLRESSDERRNEI